MLGDAEAEDMLLDNGLSDCEDLVTLLIRVVGIDRFVMAAGRIAGVHCSHAVFC